MAYKIKRVDVYNYLRSYANNCSNEDCKNLAVAHVVAKFNCNSDTDSIAKIKRVLQNSFFKKYFGKWQAAKRTDRRFRDWNKDWLDKEMEFDFGHCSTSNNPEPKENKCGRPRKSFEDSGAESQRKKARMLMESENTSKLLYATTMSLRASGNASAVKLLKEIQPPIPTVCDEILNTWTISKSASPTAYTADEAVSLIITDNLSKAQYKSLRKGAIERHHNLYPSYELVLMAKKKTYPPNLSISESLCEVPLESLLHHTCQRLFKYLQPSFLHSDEQCDMVLMCKWRFDGSSGYSQYKQLWTEGRANEDASLFVTSLVPLQLKHHESQEIVWDNPASSSTRFCRPLRLQWVQESDEVSRQEKSYIDTQIAELTPFIINNCRVSFSLSLTMIDGKVCNALTGSTSMMCNICKAKISKLNDIDSVMQLQEDSTCYQYGLSTLHAYIRCFECLLHIAYRLDIKTWKVSKKDGSKEILEATKKEIQRKFKAELGLKVDMPKQGFGSTNDGNTARRFFNNCVKSAEITGLNEDLVRRISIILKAMSSGCKIDVIRFKEYTVQTARLYVSLYPWYYMPPSVHKILIHGTSIINNVALPIGKLSEEALEANHKLCKKFRTDYSRKHSRLATNEDMMHRLLLRSDPLISLSGNHYKNQDEEISPEIMNLLEIDESKEN